MTLGEKIKAIRKERGFTQKKLGELCGINEANIRKYELGKQNPKIETIDKIASALGISAFELMGSDYFDKKYPEIAQDSKEFEGFIDYLRSLNYIVNTVKEPCKIPVELLPDHIKRENEGQTFEEGETFSIELIRDGESVILQEEQFIELQTEVKDSIEFKLWKANTKEKKTPGAANTKDQGS